MKLAPRDAAAFFARPDPRRAGLLIYGADAMRVALKRQDAVAALIGPSGEAEMRLDRIAAADLRRDGALLLDAVKASGFFPGQRAALVEDAGDGLAEVIAAALSDWREGDAMIVVTAGSLTPRSALRKLFEDHPNALAAAIYDDPPSRADVEAALRTAGLGDIRPDAMAAILDLSRALDPGDFRQFLEKLALYKLGDTTPLSPAEVAASAPQSTEADIDDLLHAVAESQDAAIGPLLRRLEAQGVLPVTLCIGAERHFRTLHSAAADPKGAASGISRARPPVNWKHRDRMQRQAERWGIARLEQALTLLVDTDLALRSSTPVPPMPLMERTLVRLARMTT
jgi:DNA polymerase-3 subunit delta